MSDRNDNGFIIAAPHSGSGKTIITLGLLRALKNAGVPVGPAKAGPDFIDPAFHSLASGQTCMNLDPWGMRDETLLELANHQQTKGPLIVEAMMGLFDGAADGSGSAADLAELLNLPIVLVVDCSSQSHSIGALISGFHQYRPATSLSGIILNRVGSPRHEAMLRDALADLAIPIFGVVMRNSDLELPSRHLGLVQAEEHAAIDSFMENAARVVSQQINIQALLDLVMAPLSRQQNSTEPQVFPMPLGQRIALADDQAFRFSYAHQRFFWQEQGVEVFTFSPLNNEAPDEHCDAVFLPGGYPELHLGKLADNQNFILGLQKCAAKGLNIYGECGGYMVLGEGVIDADGRGHKMANLLPLSTSIAERKLNLGYREVTTLEQTALGLKGTKYSAHEFHYSTIAYEPAEANADRVFEVKDARGTQLPPAGLKNGNVFGSYMHLIDRCKTP